MDILTLGTACGLFVVSVVCDQRSRRVPNAVPAALAILFVIQALFGTLPSEWWQHLAVGAAFLTAGFVGYLLGGFGGGDGKLAAVAGLWVGPGALGSFLMVMAACALVLSVIGLVRRGEFLRRGLPFAWAIAPPAIVVLLPRTGLLL